MVCVVISYHYLTSTTLKRRWGGAWGSATLNLVQPRKKPRCVPHIKVCTSGPGPLAIGLSKSWLGRAIWGLTVRRRALPCPCLAPAYEHLGHEVVPARLVASLMIPVCSATFSYASGSSDSQLEPCLDRLGIGSLDWRLPSMPYVQTLTMRYASI